MNIYTPDFLFNLGQRLFVHLVGNMSDAITDSDFAKLLARCGNGQPCNEFGWIGVSDGVNYSRSTVVWNPNPFKVKHIRLTSGSDSPEYSFDSDNVHTEDPNTLGEMILGNWNARITNVSKRYSSLRAIFLIKGDSLSTVSVFVEDILKFLPEEYEWEWDQDGLLTGYIKGTNIEKFTWQPHCSQFTITTNVPENRLKFCIRRPPLLNREEVLTTIKFDPSWIEVVA